MVHQYQLNGYNIVLDTCSGSVHVVDDVAYDVIAMYKEHSADEIVAALLAKYGSRPDVTEADLRQCLEDVASLEAAGKLWAPDVYKDMAFDFKNRQTVVKALCLHVAHTCNLNCSYCFASQGRYQGDRALMSFEVGKRHGLPHRELRHPPQPRGRFLRRRAADELRHGQEAGGLLPRAGENS